MARRMGFGKGSAFIYILSITWSTLYTVGRSHIGNIKGQIYVELERGEENDKQEKQTEQKKDLLNQSMYI